MEPTEAESNSVTDDIAMLDSTTALLQSAGDHPKTLENRPPQPPSNPLAQVLLWQTQVGGCNSPATVNTTMIQA